MTNRSDVHREPTEQSAPPNDGRTRAQVEGDNADEEIDRQQDVAGRRENAGQPSGDDESDGNQGRSLKQRNPAEPGDDLEQQTQQQQRQTPSGSQTAAVDRKEG